QVGFHVPDDFLDGQDVLGELDDRAAHPGEVVGVGITRHVAHPSHRAGSQPWPFAETPNAGSSFALEVARHRITGCERVFSAWAGRVGPAPGRRIHADPAPERRTGGDHNTWLLAGSHDGQSRFPSPLEMWIRDTSSATPMGLSPSAARLPKNTKG